MRDKASPQDIERVLARLHEVWLVCPHQRLGQLLINLSWTVGANDGDLEAHLWNMDEDDICNAIDLMWARWREES